MIMGSHPVKSRINNETRVVGQASFPIYDSVEEAIGHVGAPKVLELVNAQTRTNELNRVRGMATGEPSKSALRAQALSSLSIEEFTSCAGKPGAIETLLDQKVEALRQQHREAVAAAAAASPASEDDDENA